MYNTFISVVGIIADDKSLLKSFLEKTYQLLRENFQDFEVILVNNGILYDLDDALKDLHGLHSYIRILTLSKSIDPNNAIVAGLDHANGDYVIVMDTDLSDPPALITKLYEKTQDNNDVVYLRLKERKLPILKMLLFRLFYYIMNKYSDIQIDFNMSEFRIISRRALNSILRVREKLRYMKGIYSLVGYKTNFIEIDLSSQTFRKKPVSYSQLFRAAVSAITSFTDIPNKLLLYVFLASVTFTTGTLINALCVKVLGFNVFGYPAPQVQGWTFLMVFLSMSFTINYIILYVIGIFLFSINREIKDRPIYILESIQRLQDNSSSVINERPIKKLEKVAANI